MNPNKTSRILELGLGTGLNCILSYVYGDYHGYNIDYVAYDLYPLPAPILNLLNYKMHIGHGDFEHCWQSIHDSPGDQLVEISDRFRLTKHLRSFHVLDPGATFDLIYHDAFSPAAQGEFWERSFLERLYHALTPGGLLTTYCAKGSFKRALKEVGFHVEGRKGPPGKREITVAIK